MSQYTPTSSLGIGDFDAVRLAVADSEDILNWSYGEVTKPETINYRTQKPERDGLFCERIFGPVKDINPHDSKLKGVRSREVAVDKNGEIVTKSIVRRERMGHIALAAPVAHIWFMRGTPSAMSLLLDISVKSLERVAYFATYVIIKCDDEKVEQYRADNEAEYDGSKKAIELRYQKMQEEDPNLDIQKAAKERNNELEDVEARYILKKNQLDSLAYGNLLPESEYRDLLPEYQELIEVKMGAEALKTLLDKIDLEKLIEDLKVEEENAKGQRQKRILKRLKTLEGMQVAGIKPSSLVMTVIPVIPPDLRPMVQLTGGRFATSDLNDLYRRVINRNNRLKKLQSLNAPEVIQRNEKRMLQEAVDALVDNSATKGGRAASSTGGRRRLKSLSDMLKGKQGRFRQNLLGKRVDYSGRSVIVVGPELEIDQCGLPKQMAIELFKPFVIAWLLEHEYASNLRNASRLIEAGEAVVWDALDAVIEGRYILLNRAPSLHRLSIQAFQPKLIDGKAIQLHPLVAAGFNADYDGDQMAVHLPLSDKAQKEARELMTATANLLKPANGSPVLNIGQDVVLGNYYLTYDRPGVTIGEEKPYSSVYEAEMAYDAGVIELQTPIRVFAKREIRNTTLGRVIFNEALPYDFPYDNSVQNKKQLKKVLARIFDKYGAEITARTADKLKNLSFKYATVAAVSTGKEDYVIYDEIGDMINDTDAKASQVQEQYYQGFLSDEERYKLVVKTWSDLDENIKGFLASRVKDADNSIAMMINSGARGDISNLKWASANIGVMQDAHNRSIELPIRSNFKHGLSSLEYFVATRGARKGLINTALNTADSGYLTRRLVDVSQDVFTIEDQEGDDYGYKIYRNETEISQVDLGDRIYGRYLAEDIEGYAKAGDLVTRELADKIQDDPNITEVSIQSVLSSNSPHGIPQHSYGIDMATGHLVDKAQPVGVIAAQSVGELGTQLTLKTFHKGGEAGADITSGLPRVEELFEARNPKGQAIMSEIAGNVEVWQDGNTHVVQVTPTTGEVVVLPLGKRKPIREEGELVAVGEIVASEDEGVAPIIAPFDAKVEFRDGTVELTNITEKQARYSIPESYVLTVKSGDKVAAGDQLTTGSLNLQDLMKLKGVEAVQRYIMNSVLAIYANQGDAPADKHMEVIIRQMFSRVEIEDPGDSTYVAGDIVSKAAVIDTNRRLRSEGKETIKHKQLLLGITKVSVWSDSFLSAASFQDTTRVLINAAISGRVDYLQGLKENVIIGRKIPVGTGAGDQSETVETPLEAKYRREAESRALMDSIKRQKTNA